MATRDGENINSVEEMGSCLKSNFINSILDLGSIFASVAYSPSHSKTEMMIITDVFSVTEVWLTLRLKL